MVGRGAGGHAHRPLDAELAARTVGQLHDCVRRGDQAGSLDAGGGRMWRRDGGDARGRRLLPGRSAMSSGPPSQSGGVGRAGGSDDARRCHPHADDAWLLENPGFVSGGNLRWWRDQFAPIERSAEAGLGDAYDFLSKEASTVPAGRRTGVPAVHAGRHGAEWNSAARSMFCGSRWRRAAIPDARSARRERVRLAGHPGGDAERRARDTQADDRRRRRQGAALAADQGRRHRASRPRADERRDDGDGCRDPGCGGCGRARVRGRRRRRVRQLPARRAPTRPRAT